MTDWEEKVCQLCIGLAGIYHRRGHMMLQGETDKAEMLNVPIRHIIEDLRWWLEKGLDKNE